MVRSRLPGTRFAAFPASGSTKLKEYFINKKIPWEEREQTPLLVSAEGRIYALLGLAVDHEARVSPQTERILVIKRERISGIEQY